MPSVPLSVTTMLGASEADAARIPASMAQVLEAVMADPKAFLTIPRRSRGWRPVEERVRDWNEVYAGQRLLPVVSEQAERCMDCGIPFCHGSCPLGNLIPEWNELAARGDWAAASERLHATNNFPEFTGRLCPAPCESGCVLAIDADPVTIEDIEAAIADHAWELGLVQPLPPEKMTGRTVAVIGSGPAGLACAQQLTRAGHTVAVYERADRAGGLLRYGIPSFKMEKSHLDRRITQMRAEGTVFRTGVAVGTDLDAGHLAERYDAVVVAVGATAWRELAVPGRELAGIHQAMEFLPLANRAQQDGGSGPSCSPITAQGRNVVIIGGGDTGADCLGTVLRQHPASVTQLDINPRRGDKRSAQEPWPTHPRIHRVSHAHEEGRELARLNSPEPPSGHRPPRTDDDVRLFSASAVRFTGDGSGHVRSLHLVGVEPEGRRPLPGTEQVIPAELVLLALGFSGPERDNGLIDQLGLRMETGGGIARDPDFGSGSPNVFVAGDAGRGQSLIVWAIAEGRSVAASVDRHLTGSTDLPMPVRPGDRALVV